MYRLSSIARIAAVLLFILFNSAPVFAASGRADYDRDDNGLIEIDDLADLNEIRNNLDGTTLYEVSTGCPDGGCNGFELMTDLDFDTNADAVIDANDAYWNDGSGWLPIGSSLFYELPSPSFSATFEGNDHLIRNLYIDRASEDIIGLFGHTENAVIRNLGLSGDLMQVNGSSAVGGLAGRATSTTISNSFTTGVVTGGGAYGYVGGLAGSASSITISNSFATGAVTGTSSVGGLAGSAYGATISNSFTTGAVTATGAVTGTSDDVGGLAGSASRATISNSFATGEVSGSRNVGGLVGSASSASISNSYWGTDSTGQDSSEGSSSANGYLGDTLANLQCPTAPDNSACSSNTLYAGWDTTIWDFGTSNQLPGLILAGKTYRDTDSDGVPDADDAWPILNAASLDADGDGHPDAWNINCDADCIAASGLMLDNFPNTAAAWQDEDRDGLPDSWAASCDSSCQSASGLTLDSHLDDFDNDGLNTAADTDDDGDGQYDADVDSDGLIDIDSLEELNAIRFSLQGLGQVMSDGGALDTSGCPARIYQGRLQNVCQGYELNSDLDFDTNTNAVMDANDTYWNDGSGWEPVGSSSSPSSYFSATFDGNGYLIRNLYIDRTSSDYIGLFGYTRNAVISNLGLSGDLMQVNGRSSVGSLAGYARDATISNSFATGAVSGSSYVGGLAGRADSATISNSFATGAVSGSSYTVGGLVGRALGATISNSFATGAVSGTSSSIGGLIGYAYTATIRNSYWATDSTGQDSSSYSSSANGYLGDTLANLKCPIAPEDSDCSSNTLYAGWDISIWDFGTTNQLPGLIIAETIYRDTDGDGVLDSHDAFPLDSSETIDTDGDGIGNNADTNDDNDSALDVDDAFPLDSSETIDTDSDGIGNNADTDDDGDGYTDTDENAAGSDPLDSSNTPTDTDGDFVSDITDTDDDNDGVPDADDAFPLDATGSSSNDDVDTDDDGLIELYTLVDLDAMRDDLSGGSLFGVTAGCPLSGCNGYELMADLDFDSNGDGVINANDAHWNNGEGWQPVGSDTAAFSAVFEGNNHLLKNLYINRSISTAIGLFAYVDDARISNLGLIGALTEISGYDDVGLLAGSVVNSDIDTVFVQGSVSGTQRSAGLIGYLDNSTIDNAYSQVGVTGMTGSSLIAGLVADARNSSISDSYAAGAVSGDAETGGLIAYASNVTTSESYWDSDVSTQASNAAGDAHTTSELQCPQSAADTECATVLYTDWDEALWDFGTDTQYPVLIFDGVALRDSDNDGVLDDDDAFPTNEAASVDADNNGLPDAWNSSCDSDCQANSGLTLDSEVSSGNNSGSSGGGGGGGLISPLALLFLLGLQGFHRRKKPREF